MAANNPTRVGAPRKYLGPLTRENLDRHIRKDAETGCWVWTHTRNRQGYGMKHDARRLRLAHRLVWELLVGPIPEGGGYHGTCVLHRCDRPACVNPAHLFLGDHLANVRDSVTKGRNSRGERKNTAKLTEAQVRDIRARYAAGGVLQRELGEEYGVRKTHISLIVRGAIWRHLP